MRHATHCDAFTGGIFGTYNREGKKDSSSSSSKDNARRRLQQPPDLPDVDEVQGNMPDNVNVPCEWVIYVAVLHVPDQIKKTKMCYEVH